MRYNTHIRVLLTCFMFRTESAFRQSNIYLWVRKRKDERKSFCSFTLNVYRFLYCLPLPPISFLLLSDRAIKSIYIKLIIKKRTLRMWETWQVILTYYYALEIFIFNNIEHNSYALTFKHSCVMLFEWGIV